jgi:hypothetical protein
MAVKASKRAKKDTWPCDRCGEHLTKGQRKSVAGGEIVCRDRPACRQRVLSVTLGIKLFTRYPRERTFAEMDIRPASARPGPKGEEPLDKKWAPVPGHTEDSRVMAGWLYHSWCYPAGYEYAVELNGLSDADDVVYDKYAPGGAKVLTQQALARILGMAQPNVNRATKRLVAIKELTIDEDGRVYPVAVPEVSRVEREALLNTDGQLGPERSTIPVELRQMVEEALDGYEEYLVAEAAAGREVARIDYRTSVLKVCEEFNGKLQEIRTDRKQGIVRVCSDIATLLSRPLDFTKRSSSSQSTPTTQVPRAPQPTSNDDGERGSLKELYAAGAGKGALSKLPSHGERPAALVGAVMAEELGMHVDAAAVAQLLKDCKAIAKDVTAAEIAGGVRMKAGLAKKKDSPVGFLLTAVPNLFRDGGLEKIREQLARETAAAAEQARANEARRHHAESAAELFLRVDAAWSTMADEDRQLRITQAKRDLQAAHGTAGTVYRRSAPAQRELQAISKSQKDLEDELTAEISHGAS